MNNPAQESVLDVSAMTFSLMTINLKGLFVTLSINDTQHCNSLIKCHYAECRDSSIDMLNVIMPRVAILRDSFTTKHQLQKQFFDKTIVLATKYACCTCLE